MDKLELLEKILLCEYQDITSLLGNNNMTNDLIVRLTCVNKTLDRVRELIGMIKDGKITSVRE